MFREVRSGIGTVRGTNSDTAAGSSVPIASVRAPAQNGVASSRRADSEMVKWLSSMSMATRPSASGPLKADPDNVEPAAAEAPAATDATSTATRAPSAMESAAAAVELDAASGALRERVDRNGVFALSAARFERSLPHEWLWRLLPWHLGQPAFSVGAHVATTSSLPFGTAEPMPIETGDIIGAAAHTPLTRGPAGDGGSASARLSAHPLHSFADDAMTLTVLVANSGDADAAHEETAGCRPSDIAAHVAGRCNQRRRRARLGWICERVRDDVRRCERCLHVMSATRCESTCACYRV